MSQSNAPPPTRSMSIQRKAVGRKPVGGGSSTISRTPSVSGAPGGVPSVIPGGIGVASQQSAFPGSPATHGVAQGDVALPSASTQPHWVQNLPDGSGTPRRTSAVSSLSRSSSTAAPMQNGRSRGSIVYDSLAGMSAPQQYGHLNQFPGNTRPQHMEQLTSVNSNESFFSYSSDTSGWPTSPGSTSSYQTGYTSPLSRSSTGPVGMIWAGEAPGLHRSMSVSSSASSPPELPTCNQCRAVILPNLSIYDCLICSAGGISTKFCVYCFTKGVASAGHLQHDQSYYVSESDPTVEPEQKIRVGSAIVLPVPTHIWEAKKNAAGRIWYRHRMTGYRTHIRPYAAAVPPAKVPAGWEVRTNPDGKKYYYHSSTGTSSWKRPPVVSSLPPGWREVRTPDSVSFYVHDTLQLACWERPGELPKTATNVRPHTASTEEASQPSKGKKSSGKSSAVHGIAAAGAAITVASSIAQLSDAADLSPQGILSATIAAARLTSHGAKFASKKMRLGKLANSKKLRRASQMFGAGVAVASMGDGGDFDGFDGGEDCEQSDDSDTENGDGSTQCGEETVFTETDYYQESYTATYQESYDEPYSPMAPIYEQPPGGPFAYQPGPESAQLPVVAGDPSNIQSEQSPIVVNNMYVTENVFNETTVEQTNIEVNENVQNEVTVSENVENDVQVTDSLQENTIVNDNTQLNSYSTVEAPTINNFQTVESVAPMIDTPPDIAVPAGAGLPPDGISEYYPPPMCDPVIPIQPSLPNDLSPDTLPGEVYPPTVSPTGPVPDDSVPPLVFNPVLAGPMMVNPPAEQNGVVFAPTYV